jgi:hypothetical protein
MYLISTTLITNYHFIAIVYLILTMTATSMLMCLLYLLHHLHFISIVHINYYSVITNNYNYSNINLYLLHDYLISTIHSYVFHYDSFTPFLGFNYY